MRYKWFGAIALCAVAITFVSILSNRMNAADPPAASRVLRHVVLFQFKADSPQAEVAKVVDAFRQLPSKIPQVKTFEYGVNNSPEGLNEKLTHCFLLTFASEADRDAYLVHPEHKAFVTVLKPHLERPVVVDYWSEK